MRLLLCLIALLPACGFIDASVFLVWTDMAVPSDGHVCGVDGQHNIICTPTQSTGIYGKNDLIRATGAGVLDPALSDTAGCYVAQGGAPKCGSTLPSTTVPALPGVGYTVIRSMLIFGAACGVKTGGALGCAQTVGLYPMLEQPPAGTFSDVCLETSRACALSTGGTIACWSDTLGNAFKGTAYTRLSRSSTGCAAQRGDTLVELADGTTVTGFGGATSLSSHHGGSVTICGTLADRSVVCRRNGQDLFNHANLGLSQLGNDDTLVCGLTASNVPRCFQLSDGSELSLIQQNTYTSPYK